MMTGLVSGGIEGYNVDIADPFLIKNSTSMLTPAECGIILIGVVALAAWYYSIKQTGDQVDEILKEIDKDANPEQSGVPQTAPTNQQGTP